MISAKDLYNHFDGIGSINDYTPILESFGHIAIIYDQDGYQGDSWVLYDVDNRIGFLNFGWGSCSGCDALLACESFEDVDNLIAELHDGIKWFDSKSEALKWFKDHDWEGDYCWDIPEFRLFLRDAIEFLSKD